MVSGGGWTVGVGRLALRGDVLVRAYRRPAHAHNAQRHLVFACQFHTCAVADHTLSFTKQQLDHAAHGNFMLFPSADLILDDVKPSLIFFINR